MENASKTISEKPAKSVYMREFDVWALGITVVIGGQYFSWNAGLTAGFGSYLIGTFLIGSAYFSLCLCASELTSALPFAGGAYGLARCTLGFCSGFLVGCCETAEYICYVATSTISLTQIITSVFTSVIGYEPLVWLGFYVSALLIHIFGGKYFWRLNVIAAAISILLVIVFLLGSLPYVNFRRYSVTESGEYFVGGMSEFLRVLPIAAWFFVGVEALNMSCDDVNAPRRAVPKGQISCIVTLNITAILVMFVCASLPGGIDNAATALAPLNTGHSLFYFLPLPL